jgi:hypothetical protein
MDRKLLGPTVLDWSPKEEELQCSFSQSCIRYSPSATVLYSTVELQSSLGILHKYAILSITRVRICNSSPICEFSLLKFNAASPNPAYVIVRLLMKNALRSFSEIPIVAAELPVSPNHAYVIVRLLKKRSPVKFSEIFLLGYGC